jgi:hypothetical protein
MQRVKAFRLYRLFNRLWMDVLGGRSAFRGNRAVELGGLRHEIWRFISRFIWANVWM